MSRELRLHTFLVDHYILKLGEYTSDTYFILDGSVHVMCLGDNPKADTNQGRLVAGDFYSTSLHGETDTKYDKFYFQKSEGEFPPQLLLDPHMNFEGKSVCNLIAMTLVTVGLLSSESLELISHAFP